MMKALAAALVLLTSLSQVALGQEEQGNYGVDVSFPIHVSKKILSRLDDNLSLLTRA